MLLSPLRQDREYTDRATLRTTYAPFLKTHNYAQFLSRADSWMGLPVTWS